MSEQKTTTVKDVTAPIRRLTIGGQSYELVFNNRFIREVETVYDVDYGCPKPAPMVFAEANAGMMRALYALFYAAARAGGLKITFAEFEETFSLMDVEGVQELLQQAVDEALPEPEKN